MRLVAAEITGFRSFAGTQALDLDADAVIISGANGQGKTSILDAILWAMVGSVPRLGNDEHVVSLYSESGEARVSLDLRDDDGAIVHIVRHFDGEEQRVLVSSGDDVLRGPAATSRLVQLLWSPALMSADSDTALAAAVTRSIYLQQDRVRDFVESDDEHDRFAAISELVGAGSVSNLHERLDTARKRWKEVTNRMIDESKEFKETLERLQTTMEGLRPIDREQQSNLEKNWSTWWERTRDLGVTLDVVPSPDATDAPSAVDVAVRQLQGVVRATDRRRELAQMLASETAEVPTAEAGDVDDLEENIGRLESEIEQTRGTLREAEEAAAERRRQQVEQRESSEELRALADLALRHLDDKCPVCRQTYNAIETRQYLEGLGARPPETSEEDEYSQAVSEVAISLEEFERQHASASLDFQKAQTAARDLKAKRDERLRRIDELGLSLDASESDVVALEAGLAATIGELQTHIKEGEDLALDLARMAEGSRIGEYESKIEENQRSIEDLESEISRREKTNKIVNEIWDAMSDASTEVVEEKLGRMDPLLRRIYSGIDPHPSFREVRLMSKMRYSRGRVSTRLHDQASGKSTEAPEKVLSSSQVNALAVAIFLALNLGTPHPPLMSIMLDDPMQNLDDIHLLGLVDLLRRVRDRRQLLITTHDDRFAALLRRKLRPVTTGRVTLVELEGWARSGPVVHVSDVPVDADALRIAG